MGNNKVVFVGSFKKSAKDGSVGGQMFASRSLIHSSITKEIEFIKLDTTALSIPPKPAYIRTTIAIGRLFQMFYILLFKNPSSALIFSSSGFSFWEKGIMGLMAKLVFSKRVVFAPRSGHIIKDIEQSKLFKSFLVYLFSKVDVVLCQGEQWKEFYMKATGLPASKFVVQKNWLDVSEYIGIQRNEVAAVKPMQIAYISWIEEYKGIKELVEVMKRIKHENIAIKVNAYGNGTQSDWLRHIIISEGLEDYIAYHGWANHETKMQALRDADVFVLPSYTEGIPNSLLEAMSSQLACIATNVGGIPSVLENNKTGLMIQPKSEEELYSAIVDLYHHPDKRLRLAKDARLYAIDNHHIENLKGKISRILIPQS
jgi:glycosyltransferase involved in cell wall biosynthesis